MHHGHRNIHALYFNFQILLLDKLHLLHLTWSLMLKLFILQQRHADSMSRPDSQDQEWNESFQNVMNGLKQQNVFQVADRPPDSNPTGTTMILKYKMDQVKNTITCIFRLCLLLDSQKEGVDFFKIKTYSAVLNFRENWALYSLAAANHWYMFSSDITQAFKPRYSFVLPPTTWV